jgi:hypothetical protein
VWFQNKQPSKGLKFERILLGCCCNRVVPTSNKPHLQCVSLQAVVNNRCLAAFEMCSARCKTYGVWEVSIQSRHYVWRLYSIKAPGAACAASGAVSCQNFCVSGYE